eukprot:2368417-Pleurochrysis_carterae.AAC.3
MVRKVASALFALATGCSVAGDGADRSRVGGPWMALGGGDSSPCKWAIASVMLAAASAASRTGRLSLSAKGAPSRARAPSTCAEYSA